MENWSVQFAEKYRMQPPADLVAWLDSGAWDDPGGAEYHLALQPSNLLDPEPGTIWAGFMLPDTLPIVGNRYGDWLCLRVDWEGQVSEVVAWHHGGGDWKPFGATLAEALLLDAALLLTFGRRHEFGETQQRTEQPFTKAEWAFDHVPSAVRIGRFWQAEDAMQTDLLYRFRDLGIAEVGVRRELALQMLHGPLKARCNEELARRLEIAWEPDMVRGLFDEQLFQQQHLDRIANRLGLPVNELYGQNWEGASLEADAVTLRRQDLGWAFDISGWDQERQGNIAKAVQRYLAGLRTSVFTDDTLSFRTHWFPLGFGKFSAWRLYELRDELDTSQRTEDYLQQFWANDPNTLRQRISSYWLSRALKSMQKERFREAYAAYYRAGWDCGLLDVRDFEQILDGMIEAAERGGAEALAEIARLHRQSL